MVAAGADPVVVPVGVLPPAAGGVVVTFFPVGPLSLQERCNRRLEMKNLAPRGCNPVRVQSLRWTKSKADPFRFLLKSENGTTTGSFWPLGVTYLVMGMYDESEPEAARSTQSGFFCVRVMENVEPWGAVRSKATEAMFVRS